jgi:hypothetical protein
VLGFPVRLFTDRRLVYGDPMYIVGILYGAIRWLLTEHRAER